MKKYITKTMSAIFLLFITLSVQSQTTGDYRSAANGNWSTIAAWERFNGSTWVAAPSAPSSADGVISIRSPHTIIANSAITTDQTIVQAGGILTVTSTLTLNDVAFEEISVNGTMNFNAGTIDGTGNILINNVGNFLLSTIGVKQLGVGVILTNNGTMTWQEGGLNFSGLVANTNIFNISASALWQFSGGFTNTGTINKTTGSTTISTPWSNSGTINLSGGSLTSSDVFTNTGTINITNGAAWQNSATFNHNTGSVVSGTGSFANSGTLTLNISQVFPATLVFSNSNTINGNGDLTVNNDFVIQGNIIGSGAFTLNGNATFPIGTLGRSLTIGAGRTLLLSTVGVKSLSTGVTITNNGTMTWQEGGLNFSGAVVNNNIFNISASSALWQFPGGLTNTGTINKTSTGNTSISTPWSNSGTINLSAGTLTSSDIFTNTGTINFTNNAQWQNASTFNHNTGSVVSGTGSFANSGTLTLNISQVFPASLGFSNSNIINGNGNLTVNNDFVIQGTITGSGAFTLNGNGTFTIGTLGRSLTIGAGRTLLLSTAGVKSLSTGVTITNNGTMTWQEGGLNFEGAVVNNNIFNISASALWQFGGGLTNNGTLTRTNTGSANISTPVTNAAAGVIKGIGTLIFSHTITNNGTIEPGLSPGIFIVDGLQPFSANSTLRIEIAGNGGVGQPTGHDQLQRGSNLTLIGTLTVVETGTVPDGDYTIISLSAGTITGTFSSTNLPANYSVIYNSNNVVVRKGAACPPSVSINANPGNTICAGTNVTFTATPTNGGTPSYQWKLNGNNVGTNSNTYSNNALINADVVTVVMTSSLACANPATATSNGITMAVTATVTPSVSISANPGNTICAGTNVIFTATPTNGGTASYQWKLNGNNVGTNSSTYSNNALANGNIITVVITSSLACASPTTATSNGITMTVTATVTPSVSIAANPGNTICAGTNVTFTATPTNGGTPSYQWKLNGNNVGTSSNTYSNNTLANGNVVTVVMTSSLACANPATATSNGITMAVTSTVAPSVSIAANPGNTICAGTNVTFTATPTNGGTPSYQWKLNGNNVGTNSNTYSNNALVNADEVTVVMTSSLLCASPTTATSNGIAMFVRSIVSPSVSIAANSGNTICTGTNVTFTATPTNGGGTPSYQWKLNGNNVGANSNTYSNAALVNADVVNVVMTSSLTCASPTTATSNGITMAVTSTVAPSVSIAANPGNTICKGTNVTFTATPTNGGTPSYQWKLNGNNVGANSNTYSTNTLDNDDIVAVVMTSSLACANPSTATSVSIQMVVNPFVSSSVSIAANPGNTICAGTNVTFTATPTNGGTPSYQWKLNGNNVGTNSNTYSNNALVNGDVVTVLMTSSLACAGPAVGSFGIAMVVTSTVIPSVSIAANPGNTICTGTRVTFTATPTNGGTPSYQWKLNGNNVGANSNTYTNGALVNADVVTVLMTSSLACASPTTATSNGIIMAVNAGTIFYRDQDGDGYGNNSVTQQVCLLPAGYVINNTDCNDNNAAMHPGATEVCSNSIDDDCDGQTDESCNADDADGDGYTIQQGDCNDNNSAIHPGATELCDNEIDDNCNGYIDENCLDNLPVLTLRTYPVKEGNTGTTIVEVELKLDRPSPTQLQFNYATSDEDAIAGLDYIATNGVLIMPAGATSGMVNVRVIGDALKESNERFRLNFSIPINVIIVGDPYSRIMIIDDDKGKGNGNSQITKAPTEELQEGKPAIPNIIRRNSVWQIPFITNMENRVEIMNISGQLIFRADNYRHNIPIGNVSTGLYFYRIRAVEKDKKIKYYAGRLLITE